MKMMRNFSYSLCLSLCFAVLALADHAYGANMTLTVYTTLTRLSRFRDLKGASD